MEPLRIFRMVGEEFDDVSDEMVELWLEMTIPLVSEKRFGKVYEQALALLTAHRMKLAGFGDNTFGKVGDTLRVGSYSEGETSVSFTPSQQTNLSPDADLALTTYGLKYLALRRMCIIPILASGASK